MIYAPPGIIPNGALINGVCNIYQSTKPTTRPDGSALVVGDIWNSTSTGVEGFWNGTYWLGERKSGSLTTLNGAGGTTPAISIFTDLVLVEYINWFGLTGAVHDATNNFGLRWTGFQPNGSAAFSSFFATTSAIGAASTYNIELANIVVNRLNVLANNEAKNLGLSFFQINSPTTSGVNTNLRWRLREIL